MNLCLFGSSKDTDPILIRSIEVTGEEHNEVLALPNACSKSASYIRKVPATIERFGRLGVDSSVLHDYEAPVSTHELEDKFSQAS